MRFEGPLTPRVGRDHARPSARFGFGRPALAVLAATAVVAVALDRPERRMTRPLRPISH